MGIEPVTSGFVHDDRLNLVALAPDHNARGCGFESCKGLMNMNLSVSSDCYINYLCIMQFVTVSIVDVPFRLGLGDKLEKLSVQKNYLILS